MTLVLLVALALQSNAEALAGRVIDTASVPVPGALVEVDGHGVTVSDEHGGSRFAQLAARVSLDGFEPHESIVEPGTTRIEIVLGPAKAGHYDSGAPPRFEDHASVTARAPLPPVESVFTRQPIDLRIHRSAIVRLDHIAEVQPVGSSRYRVTLVDGTTLVVSRSRAGNLKDLIL